MLNRIREESRRWNSWDVNVKSLLTNGKNRLNVTEQLVMAKVSIVFAKLKGVGELTRGSSY